MRIGIRWLGCLAWTPLLLVLGVAPVPQSAGRSAPSATVTAISPSASIASEVRLRKLHLVRPDLILYPILYDVYC